MGDALLRTGSGGGGLRRSLGDSFSFGLPGHRDRALSNHGLAP